MMGNRFLPDHEDLRECLPYFQMLFDHIRIGLIIADTSGTIIYYNKAQSEIDNLAVGAVVERHMCEVYDFTLETSPALQVLKEGHSLIDKVNSYRTKSGNLVHASCTIYPLRSRDSAIAGVICYSQNLSWLDVQLQNVRDDLIVTTEAHPGKTAAHDGHYSFDSLVGRNRMLQKATSVARIAAKNDSAVMLIGETGVGKEIYAQSIHYAGPRRNKPYTAINCSAVPESLLEGILFGTTKGAFTGALDKPGLFEVADKGTLFLDELGAMPPGLQGKLLRALQEKRIRRVGDSSERVVDVRILSAVGAPPLQLVRQGLMRPDFYYRLGVIKIAIPPLRERLDDLPALVRHFLKKQCAQLGKPLAKLSNDAMTLLQRHAWPGNVRELEHALEAAVSIMEHETEISVEHLFNACPDIFEHAAAEPPLAESGSAIQAAAPAFPEQGARGDGTERDGEPGVNEPGARKAGNLAAARQNAEIALICDALRKAAGNQSLAARLLSISPQLLHYKLKKFKISTQEFQPTSL